MVPLKKHFVAVVDPSLNFIRRSFSCALLGYFNLYEFVRCGILLTIVLIQLHYAHALAGFGCALHRPDNACEGCP
jgi:hypothetical protein